MQSTAPKQVQAPMKPWLTTPTLQAMHEITVLRRKEKSKFHRLNASTLYRSAKNNPGLPFQAIHSYSKAAEVVEAYREEIRTRVKDAKLMIRGDKVAWVEAVCNDIDGLRSNKTGQAFQLMRTLNKRRRRATFALTNADGTSVHDPDRLAELWLEHWKQHFGAEIRTDAPYMLTECNADFGDSGAPRPLAGSLMGSGGMDSGDPV
eukprot:1386135-Amphidinium_carterae.1